MEDNSETQENIDETKQPEATTGSQDSVQDSGAEETVVETESDASLVAAELGMTPTSEAAPPAAETAVATVAAPTRAQPRQPSSAAMATSSSDQNQSPAETRRRRGREGGRSRSSDNAAQQRADSEWDEKIIQVRRVTKVVKGGKKLSFRAVVAVGNNGGQVGIGVGKAAEVMGAIQKGIVDAKKSLVKVPLIGATIPHEIIGKQGASKITLKPAAKGTGIIAGGAARSILELAGVGDVLSKSLGSRSPLNVARATIDGLARLRTFEKAAALRGITLRQMFS
jgi:small subunit ribosomal protein S5